MSYIHRFLRPVLTAVIAVLMGAVGLYLRPRPQGHIRHMAEAGPYAPASVVEPPIDPSVDTVLFWVWMTGTAFMFIGAMMSLWWRSRPAGRHRASA